MTDETNSPPSYVIEAARQAAMASPCSKSKRGVAIFAPEEADNFARNRDQWPSDYESGPMDSIIWSRAHNGPPIGFGCGGTATCRSQCAKVCLHAEQRAIIEAYRADEIDHLELVHVKVVEGIVIAGKAPCCLECSRLAVETKLGGVWLYQSTDLASLELCADPPCHCGVRARAFREVSGLLHHGDVGPNTHTIGDPIEHRFDCPAMAVMAVWKFYPSVEFHRQTLLNHGLDSLAVSRLHDAR